MSDDMESLRTDIMTGRDQINSVMINIPLDTCAHCGGDGEMHLLLQSPYIRCGTCGATTACADTPEEAAAKWNRRP